MLAFLLVGLSAATWAGASSTGSRLQDAKDRLSQLETEIQAKNGRLHRLEGQLNVVAGQIDAATGQYQETQQAVMDTRDALQGARDRYEALRSRLDQRAAEAYMEGPGTSLDVVLGATSITDFTDRLEFLSSVTEHDSDLAVRVQRLADELHIREVSLNKVLAKQAAVIRRYNAARAELDAKFSQVKSIRNDLASKQNEVRSLVGQLKKKLAAEERAAALAALQASQPGGVFNIKDNPLHSCPVDEPRAFGDSFGAPRYAGGYHPHAGNDIMAPQGTPIRATFDGVAEADPNGLGGNAVIVRGADGYTYNAHLDSYGTLGNVTTGTIVGYVGDSGDAQGGPTHDHFEWHPNVLPSPLYVSSYGYSQIGSAIDPYPYLLQVC